MNRMLDKIWLVEPFGIYSCSRLHQDKSKPQKRVTALRAVTRFWFYVLTRLAAAI